jgi:hypothetical protein
MDLARTLVWGWSLEAALVPSKAGQPCHGRGEGKLGAGGSGNGISCCSSLSWRFHMLPTTMPVRPSSIAPEIQVNIVICEGGQGVYYTVARSSRRADGQFRS